MKYLAAIMARGHSLEYFIEGGRSRTGRLLHPKTGMLSMTVRSFLRDPVRPVVFVPVYFGYERIVEASTYISELSGAPKKKESWWDLLTSFQVLRERFGTVHVNVGEPMRLDAMLDAALPSWREQRFEDDTRLPAVNCAGQRPGAGHHARHQLGRGGHAHQPAGHGPSGQPARRLARVGAASPARAVSQAAPGQSRTARV